MWLAPGWLAGLVLPLALLVVSIVPSRPRDVATGTLRVWRALAAQAQGSEGRRRPPVVALLGALGAALAVLALARPVLQDPLPAEVWTVVVDRSPSTSLPWSPEDRGDDATRIERALERLEDWTQERGAATGRGVELRWVSGDGQASSAAALARPLRGPEREPDWSRWDRPGVVWLSDSLPEPERAVAIASGGPAVPGPVAAADGRWIEWSGEGGLQDGGPYVESRTISIDDDLPRAIATLAHEWAALRGVAPSAASADLALTRSDGAELGEAEFARDGWTGRGELLLLDADAPGDVWLAAADGRRVVVAVPGEVRIALATLEVPLADAAPFAASLGGLLDATLPPPPTVVSLAERRAAGPPRNPGPAAEAAWADLLDGAPPPAAAELAPWLAAAAALLALLTLAAWLHTTSRVG